MKICVFCMNDVAERNGSCCGTYKGIMDKPEPGELIVNYYYTTGQNVSFSCEWDNYGETEPCGAINLDVNIDLERGDRTAYSDPNILYGDYKCSECGHEYGYRLDIVRE